MIFIGIQNIAGEEWKPINAFDGYFVSSKGRIISTLRRKPLLINPEEDKDGYLRVGLYRDRKRVRHVLSRIVCEVFNGPPESSDLVCCHRDNNKKNNEPSNLRWGTQKSNIADKLIHGTHQVGSSHPRSSIDEKVAKKIKTELQKFPRKRGKLLYVSKATGVSYSIVADISRGKTWKDVTC